uniref:Uncharacterized protein n=1 Tax=Arundo donax TaxID=35708 RepID=A0A0A9HV79_ARUDO
MKMLKSYHPETLTVHQCSPKRTTRPFTRRVNATQ